MSNVPLSIGLTGAQRTGKSTLARAFAEAEGCFCLETGASNVFAQLGMDPKAEYPIETRLVIQEAILADMEAAYAKAGEQGSFIADRTPLDLAAYMLADVQRSTLAGNPKAAAMVKDYVERCLMSTGRWFSMVFLVQPGIALVEAPGKAPACPVFMEHMNALCLGLMNDRRTCNTTFRIDRGVTALERRVTAMSASVRRAQTSAEEAARLVTLH